MHTGTGRIGNDHIRSAILVDKILRQHVFHITGKEQRILDAVNISIHLSIFNSLGNVFNTNNLFGLACNKIGNSTCTRIQIIYQLIAR
ncbi:hypothetical protein SDC9_190837 [bioreactor metagenome]|uniref:Uncharacterized protein n=1 Tax=bioreactor metagenome TaxID=1076179 RepID=A0A645HW89_9ZZZZ